MGAQRTTFEKLQRDRAKKAKAAAKRERRQERSASADDAGESPVMTIQDTGGELSAPQLLALVEQIHRQFEAKEISYDDFEERKADLLSRLPID